MMIALVAVGILLQFAAILAPVVDLLKNMDE